MNLERFHAAIYELRKEIDSEKCIEELGKLRDFLQQSISQQTPESASLFKEQYAKLMSMLESSKSNFSFPTRKMVYKELDCEKYFGKGLLKNVVSTFSQNQLTPANALVDINSIIESTSAYYEKIKQFDTLLGDLDVDLSDIKPGEFEIGVSIPKNIVSNNLTSLEKEFHKLNILLKTLNEVSTGSHAELEIKTISASEWQVFFDSAPGVAACISLAIERIVALYKTNLEIKVIKQQLENKNLPKEVTEPLQRHIEDSVSKELKVIAEELVDKFYTSDDLNRKNELKNQTSQSLRYLADRLDNGATFEAHAKPPSPPKPTIESETGEKLVSPEDAKIYEDLLEATKKINNATMLIEELKNSDGSVLSINYKEDEI
jgi:hypothetical protein